jgi:DNA replication protein DnaC
METFNVRTLEEALKLAIDQIKTTKTMHFSINYDVNYVAKVICFYYEQRVQERNRSFILDEPTKDNIIHMAKILVDGKSPKFGVVLCGTFGNGKTTMLYAVRKTIHHFFEKGIISFNDFQSCIPIISVRDVLISAKENQGYRELKTNDILMIDDIGIEPKEVMDFGTITTPVVDLLEARYNRLKYTFVTTNLTPSELSEKYGPRLADRFREMFHVIGYDHPSYRSL